MSITGVVYNDGHEIHAADEELEKSKIHVENPNRTISIFNHLQE